MGEGREGNESENRKGKRECVDGRCVCVNSRIPENSKDVKISEVGGACAYMSGLDTCSLNKTNVHSAYFRAVETIV